MTCRYENTRIASSATIAAVIGSTRCGAPAPATARTARIASGPYATDVSASRDSADRPSTGVICSRDTSRAPSGGPTRTCQIAAARPERLSLRAVMLLETRAARRYGEMTRPSRTQAVPRPSTRRVWNGDQRFPA